jgi:hypothetical protein
MTGGRKVRRKKNCLEIGRSCMCAVFINKPSSEKERIAK